ncbi:glycosyltransferase family 4 protein [Dissulfurirhabdus thermomarina]|uniref:Glycosyltransferase family 4 protein n=1 Tax=Dissulfurirhabdus thermomarina TaxID=1765737 RepID=A0A6N9TJB6_DISTH|nr:glycosyltransferase family 4 protein [Dissulfurirhabdus thermomarina]NDY41352.1 glycosyltransferase family 4 protein [Dissulfurirhabdus thermomarina]NMX23265.1 glycosyltransferase family 4 protein [Dissulfurirhabdus thermomarina]
MKIAQVAPLFESVPPRLYGGTERVVSYLTEELVRLGHEVTLYASGDSRTSARLVPLCREALRLDPGCRDPLARHVCLLERVFQDMPGYDCVHFHVDYLHFPYLRRHPHPHVTTLHGRLDLPELADLYREFREMPVCAISESQKRPIPWANWVGTVHHGLPLDLHRFRPGSGRYLAFLGRISPEKRVDRAIEIAVRAGLELKIAAKVDKADEVYFRERIQPLLRHPLVDFVGEIGEDRKGEFLGDALALLFPIDWPEPFGLVMIEAMACGTPVVAYRCGSVPEVVEDGVTGFIVDGVDQAVAAVERVGRLDRRRIRRVFEERFSARRMAMDYVKIYESLAWSARRPRLAA